MRYSVQLNSGANFLGHGGLACEERGSKFVDLVSEAQNPKFRVSISGPNVQVVGVGGWEMGLPAEWLAQEAVPPYFDHEESIAVLRSGARVMLKCVEVSLVGWCRASRFFGGAHFGAWWGGVFGVGWGWGGVCV